MKNGIIGGFLILITFMVGYYLEYELSEDQTLEYDGGHLRRYEIEILLKENEEVKNA